jgi:spore maturation protein CgeB
VPSIRVFEALACAIPLVSGPWDDDDGLFTPGRDYLVAEDGVEMRRHLSLLVNDAHARSELSRHGRATILARHTCAHRVDELIAVAGDLGVRVRRPVLASEGAVP